VALSVAVAALVAGLAAPSPAGAALPLGQHLVVANSTDSIVTGDSWTITVEVDDILNQPVAGAVVWTGTVEPSIGCGSDLTASACTQLAVDQQTADGSGRVTLTKTAALNTFAVFYLGDAQSLDAATGLSVLVKTHNKYDWSGPATATLKQYAVGKTPYAIAPGQPGANHRIATGNGAAGAPRTQVSTDDGKTWTTIGRGTTSGIFPITGSRVSPVDRVNVMASKPGTYQLRLTDGGGTYEDPGTSDVMTVTVTARAQPSWLRRTNQFRSSLGLAPVADNLEYDAALAKHVRWMNIHNQLSHSETPGTTGYTNEGNEAAGASDLAYGRATPPLAVDGWIGAPFHATCLLNAYWAVGGFAIKNGWSGEWCHSSMQTLDMARGANGPVKSTLRRNYTFPSSSMKVPRTVTVNGNEAPDPVASCGRQLPSRTWSVPVVFRLAKPPAGDRNLKHARAAIRTKSGKRVENTCLFTGGTFHGSDPGSTSIARLILGDRTAGRWAVVLTRAGKLRAGHAYTATLTDGKFRQRTSFELAR
jgi:uncharacterized protein YkwD